MIKVAITTEQADNRIRMTKVNGATAGAIKKENVAKEAEDKITVQLNDGFNSPLVCSSSSSPRLSSVFTEWASGVSFQDSITQVSPQSVKHHQVKEHSSLSLSVRLRPWSVADNERHTMCTVIPLKGKSIESEGGMKSVHLPVHLPRKVR